MKNLRTSLLWFVLPAILLGLAPATFAYDRTAILHGEWWRLWTGHWVHFSASHLGWNLLVLLVAGSWLEQVRPRLLLRYTLGAAPLISLVLLALAPEMQTYGGLSGLATGVVVLLALVQLERAEPDRFWWMLILALVIAKITVDAFHPGTLFSRLDPGAFRSSAPAHAAGAGLAVVLFLSRRPAFCLPLSGATPARLIPSGKSSR